MQKEEIEKLQSIFHGMKKRIAELEAENAELRRKLDAFTQDQMAQDMADMEVISMANSAKPVRRRGLFWRK